MGNTQTLQSPPRTFTVQTTINRPANEVFDAIADPAKLEKYFAGSASGPLVEGTRVIWNWPDWGDYPVQVDEVRPNTRIALRINAVAWKKTKTDSYDVAVVFDIEPLSDTLTLVKISESGWKSDDDGIKASYENCGGWQHMADCLKAWLEHGIDLRKSA